MLYASVTLYVGVADKNITFENTSVNIALIVIFMCDHAWRMPCRGGVSYIALPLADLNTWSSALTCDG